MGEVVNLSNQGDRGTPIQPTGGVPSSCWWRVPPIWLMGVGHLLSGLDGVPLSRPGKGVPPSRPGKGVPPSQTWDGVPPIQTWEAGILIQTWDRVPPYPDLEWGYPPPIQVRTQDRGYPQLEHIACTYNASVGMPLAFTQEYFLVSNKSVTQKGNENLCWWLFRKN